MTPITILFLLFRLSFILSSLASVNSSPLPVNDPYPSTVLGRGEFPLQSLLLWITHRGTAMEHWSLVIGAYSVGGVFTNPDDVLGTPMEGSVDAYKKPSGKKSETIDLDAKAKFKSEADMKNELKKIENIVMKVKPTEKGGNCIDFLDEALQMLVKDGKLVPNAVPVKFTVLKAKDYEAVSDRTWGEKVRKKAERAKKKGIATHK